MTAKRRLRRERKTIDLMIAMYCRAHHGGGKIVCAECRLLADYAGRRIDRCPYGHSKPTCLKCPTHCYKPDMRERVRHVMRYAGPRMLFRHPLLAILHLIDGHRRTASTT